MTDRIHIDDNTHLLVLTGAGVSAESGLPTFREANGLWENHAVEKVASPEGFQADPALVWRFYSQRRAAALTCSPNGGHRALVELEQRLGERFLLVTQNVDGLHLQAGSRRVVELHGNLFTSRCSRCDRLPFRDERQHLRDLPRCELCEKAGHTALLRPHIVWFGEKLDPEHFRRVGDFMSSAEPTRLVFLAVGTSGVVYPAAGLVDLAKGCGAETWLVKHRTGRQRLQLRPLRSGQERRAAAGHVGLVIYGVRDPERPTDGGVSKSSGAALPVHRHRPRQAAGHACRGPHHPRDRRRDESVQVNGATGSVPKR